MKLREPFEITIGCFHIVAILADGVAIVRLGGRVRASHWRVVWCTIYDCLKEHAGSIIIDLEHVDAVESSVIKDLARAARAAGACQSTLTAANASPAVRGAFQEFGLLSLLDDCPPPLQKESESFEPPRSQIPTQFAPRNVPLGSPSDAAP